MSKAIDLENGLPAIKTWVEGKFVEKETGKGLSTNDYTTDEKTKLAGIAAGAEVNVQSDWNVTSTTSDAYIKNKPSIPAASSTAPKMDGTAAAGTGTTWARADHVHPTDTSRAPLASPALTGTPTAPTAAAGTNTTQIATTEFVKNAVDNVHIDVDSALDDTSTNPVQNKVVAAALDNKVDASVTDDGATTAILNNGVLASATYSQGSGSSAIYNQVRVNGATAELYGSSGTTKSASVVANQNGSVSISAINGSNTNSITLNSTQTTIENVVAPTANGDAANKKYVDDALTEAKSYADGKVAGLYNYKGSVATYAALPASPATGDVYNVEAAYGDYPAGTNWAWTGAVWDALGGSFTIDFATAAEVTAVLNV